MLCASRMFGFLNMSESDNADVELPLYLSLSFLTNLKALFFFFKDTFASFGDTICIIENIFETIVIT